MANVRKSAAAIPAYRGASMPAKFLYLYMQTLPKPAGGVMRLSFGQLMEELSMPAKWLKKAMQELSGNGLIQAAGPMVFVPRGVERIDNPNMVTSAIRKLERMEVQDGPIPAAIWSFMLDSMAPLMASKPYLSALQEYAQQKQSTAPEQVTPWDHAAAWLDDPEWKWYGDQEEDVENASSAQSFSLREISLIQTLVQSTLTTAIPAILEPLMPLLRQSAHAESNGAKVENADICSVVSPSATQKPKADGLPGASEKNAATGTPKDPFAADVDTFLNQFSKGAQGDNPQGDNPVAFLFPVRPDKNGNTHKVYRNFIHHLYKDLGDLLDIEVEMSQMIAWVEARPEKIPDRNRANKYIWSWMKRKHGQVETRLAKKAAKEAAKDSGHEPAQQSAEDFPMEAQDLSKENPVQVDQPQLPPSDDGLFQEEMEVNVDMRTPDLVEPEHIRADFPHEMDGAESVASLFAGDPVMEEKPEPASTVTNSAQSMVVSNAKVKKTLEQEFPQGFAEFWAEYPRHDAPRVAMRSWTKHQCIRYLDAILEDVRYKKENKWHTPQFIPMPSTYLNQHRWEDERVVDTSAFKGHVVKGVIQPSHDEQTKTLFDQIDKMHQQGSEKKLDEDCIDLSPCDWKSAAMTPTQEGFFA